MRFEEIKKFHIDNLLLDESNYRFKKAKDQKACVKKIYMANPLYFKGLMQSIAENDMGEPLLVYQNDNEENIVADGNRRLSALKVLYSDEYAPVESLKGYANQLRSEYEIEFLKIQAQVSEDKKLISRTVYERHSGGKNGTSRIPWAAYAAARFGYDEQIGGSKEWYIMALLSKTEEQFPELTNFLDSHNFSYEVFRRLVRAAISNQRISENIFSKRGEKLKTTARHDLIQDAISKAKQFLHAMQERKITLSRKEGGYADKSTVDRYLESFSFSPDNQELKNAKAESNHGQLNNNTQCNNSSQQSSSSSDTQSSSNNSIQKLSTDLRPNETGKNTEYGVGESKKILQKLNTLGSGKLGSLYNSLCKVSLNQHPALMYVGAWSFFEVLSKYVGNTTQEFPAFFRNQAQSLGVDKQTGKDCGNALDTISRYGNATKHSKNAMPTSAIQLKNDFEVLEPLILAALDKAISEK
ncbi:ParB/Srx family N-terminal domain-containing protein [Nitrosomonas sp.]|uniref:ParB/Srx family N-terminal domain-containing protein n=1 Tax=Nitrosomonas sp. TaxID=42353 RepID=UPI00208AA1BE|nr:ParB/Srx family N-terminal domain-containing protein [Nitrosomonas sp.]GJL76705.1 MAG: hypothetical protein NMNS02_28110 [Nitrosomonas sp.]